jgi:hypothetical protein
MGLISELVIKLSAQSDASINETLGAARKRVQDLSGEITDLAQKTTIGFGAFAVGAGVLVKSWADAAGQMEQYRAKLTTVLKSSTEASKTITDAVTMAAKTPFEVSEIVNATVQLEVYGIKAKEILPLIGDLAAGMGKNLSATTLVVAKALSGSAEGFESLRNEYGITTAKLAQYGAVLSSTGSISVKTTSELEKAKNALLSIIKTNFGGAMERQNQTWQGAISNLSDAIEKLKVALGNELAPTLASTTRGITNIIESFNKSGGALKPFIAWGTLAAGAFAAMLTPLGALIRTVPGMIATYNLLSLQIGKVAASQAWANIVQTLGTKITYQDIAAKVLLLTGSANLALANFTLAGSFEAIGTAATATWAAMAANPLGVALIAVGLLAAAATYWKSVEDERAKKMNEGIASNHKALKALHLITGDYAGKSIEDLKKMGVASQNLDEAITDMKDGMTKAILEGNTALGNYYKNAIADAQRMKKELAELEKLYGVSTHAIKAISTEMEIMQSTHAFATTAEEITYLNGKLSELQANLAGVGVGGALNLGDLTDTKTAEANLRQNKRIQAELQKQYDAAGPDQQASIKIQLDAMKTLVDAQEKSIEVGKRQNKEKLEASKSYIDQQKELNRMNIDDEIKANERLLQNKQLEKEQRKDIENNITKLKHDKEVESRNNTERTLQKELDAVKLMTSGQVKEYDRIIAKIKEKKDAQQITEKQAYDLNKSAQGSRKTQVEKDEKDSYDRRVKAAETYLDLVDKAEEMSNEERLGIIDSLEKAWYEMERQRTVTTEQAEDQIRKLIEKRAALEKKIIDANKAAEQELINLRKSALDNDIKKLGDKMKAGVNVEKELYRKLDDRMKLEMKGVEKKDDELAKQDVSQARRDETKARSEAALYEKQAEEIGSMISELQNKLPEEQDRLTKMSMESLISSLSERKGKLEESYKSATGRADIAQAQSANEPPLKQSTSADIFSQATNTFSASVKDFSAAIIQMIQNYQKDASAVSAKAAEMKMPAPKVSSPGISPDQQRAIIQQAQNNQSSSSSTTSTYIMGDKAITPTAEVAAKWGGLALAIQNMQKNGYLDSMGGSLSF